MPKNELTDIDKILQDALTGNDSGIILKSLLEAKLLEYDLSKTKAINLLGIDKDTFDDIINGTSKQPSLINIIKIAHFLEVDLYDAIPALLKSQSNENISSIEKAKKAAFVAKNFDIKKLSKIGFLRDTDDIDIIVRRILDFFGYDSIYDFEKELAIPLFSKSKRSHSDKMKDFWIKSAYQCFKKINNQNKYDRELLKDILIKSKPYSQDIDNGLFTVCKALYNAGVTVIFQNQLPTTQIRGATFVVNDKPCIVITDLFKRYSTLWFVLIHELHHVLFDLEVVKSTNYHISGDPDLFLIEEKADEFSREYFFGIDSFNYITPHINNNTVVSRLAKDLEIHTSFIYSAYQYYQKSLYNKDYYGAFKSYFPDYSLAIKNLKPINWQEKYITDIATNLKNIFELNKN